MRVNKLNFKGIISIFLLTFAIVLGFSTPALAVSGTSIVDGVDESRETLNSVIEVAVSDNRYQTSSGGYISGGNIVKDGLVDEDRFAQLTATAKQKLLQDMNNAVDKKIVTDKEAVVTGESTGSSNAVSDDTKSNWLTELQQTQGVGSQLLATILSQTKPDFVKANKIYTPFSGPIGTGLGLGAILIMAGVSLSIVFDIAWIEVPMFRVLLPAGEEGNSEKGGFRLISYAAVSSVQESEGKGDGKGGKIAIWGYFKKRSIGLLVLGFCLLYLVGNKIFVPIGYAMDLVSGFLGF